MPRQIVAGHDRKAVNKNTRCETKQLEIIFRVVSQSTGMDEYITCRDWRLNCIGIEHNSLLTSFANKRLSFVTVPDLPWIENVFRKQTYAISTNNWGILRLSRAPVYIVGFTAVTPYKLAFTSAKTYPDTRFWSSHFYCYEFIFILGLGQCQIRIHFLAGLACFLPRFTVHIRQVTRSTVSYPALWTWSWWTDNSRKISETD